VLASEQLEPSLASIIMMVHADNGPSCTDASTLRAFEHQCVVIKRKTTKYFDDLQRIGSSINE